MWRDSTSGLRADGSTSSFDATKLLCTEGQSTPCLSEDQLSTLNQVFSDYYEGDEFVYGRILPSGGETQLVAPLGELGDVGLEIGINYFRYFVLKWVRFRESRILVLRTILSAIRTSSFLTTTHTPFPLLRKLTQEDSTYVSRSL